MTISISNKLLLLGAGVAAGLLVAPKSGSQTRNTLMSKGQHLKDALMSKVQQTGVTETATTTVHNVVEKGRNIASIGKQRVNDSIEAGRRRFNEAMEDSDETDLMR